jgi:GH15 family glucan-1,4-alpha-glucosidase
MALATDLESPGAITTSRRLAHLTGRILFERVLGHANHLRLYSEQTGPQGEALGNFPQAFAHLALISAAFNRDRMLVS